MFKSDIRKTCKRNKEQKKEYPQNLPLQQMGQGALLYGGTVLALKHIK